MNLFKRRKPESQTKADSLVITEGRVIASKNVQTAVEKWTVFPLPEGYTQEQYVAAYAELLVFYRVHYGSDEDAATEIHVATMEDRQVLRFCSGYAVSGKSYHPDYYPNIVHAEDVVAGKVSL